MAYNVRTTVIGPGQMGYDHGLALHKLPGSSVAAIVSPGKSKDKLNNALGGDVPLFTDYKQAIDTVDSDAVMIATPPKSHYEIAKYALDAGKHVFTEKPIAHTVEKARELRDLSREKSLTLVVGYILEHSPGWNEFIKQAKEIEGPYDIFMELNQRSKGLQDGGSRRIHKTLIEEAGSPVVDCAPHYISIANQIVGAEPEWVFGTGIRYDQTIPQTSFDNATLSMGYKDGSIFRYGAGWGPHMATLGFSNKRVIGKDGFVQLEYKDKNHVPESDHVPAHVNVEIIARGYANVETGEITKDNTYFDATTLKGNHDNLCEAEMQYFIDAINGNVNASDHLDRAVSVSEVALAAHESALEKKLVYL